MSTMDPKFDQPNALAAARALVAALEAHKANTDDEAAAEAISEIGGDMGYYLFSGGPWY